MYILSLYKDLSWGKSLKKILAHSIFIVIFLSVFLVLTPIDHLDFYTHNKQLLSFYDTGYWRPNFLYYFLLALLSGFSRNIQALGVVAAILMAGSVYFKWTITQNLSLKIFGKSESAICFEHVPLLMLFVFSLPASYNNWYFGQVSPNQWHNSTTILLMPFSLLLYYHTYSLLIENSRKSFWWVLWLSIMNVLIKPSFLFCLLPVVGVLFIYNRFRLDWLKKATAFLPAILMIIAQYVILFIPSLKSATMLSGEEGGVAFSIFHVWGHYSDNILLSLIVSLAFPLAAVIGYGKYLLKEKLFLYTVSLSAIGLLIFACLTETGSRQFHCNFIWQAIVANYLLYWVSIYFFLKHTVKSKVSSITILATIKYYLKKRDFKALVVYSIFLLQCLGGVYYLMRMIVRNGSYA